MASTYYDSDLTAEEIDAALKAIDGVIVPANNGKVLAVDNGKIVARSVQWGGVNLQDKTVTENGLVRADEGYDGLSSVYVNVSGGGGSDDPFDLTEYIESDGNQWIDTGYIPKSNSAFEAVINENNHSQNIWATVCGAREAAASNAKTCWIGLRNQGNQFFTYNWGFSDTSYGSNSGLHNTKLVIRFCSSGLDIDKGSPTRAGLWYTGGAVTELYSMYLFSLNQAGSEFGTMTRCAMKLYRFRIYEGSNIVHEFVPWIDNNNTVCLKDTVTGNLKYNIGTGSFTYGIDT